MYTLKKAHTFEVMATFKTDKAMRIYINENKLLPQRSKGKTTYVFVK